MLHKLRPVKTSPYKCFVILCSLMIPCNRTKFLGGAAKLHQSTISSWYENTWRQGATLSWQPELKSQHTTDQRKLLTHMYSCMEHTVRVWSHSHDRLSHMGKFYQFYVYILCIPRIRWLYQCDVVPHPPMWRKKRIPNNFFSPIPQHKLPLALPHSKPLETTYLILPTLQCVVFDSSLRQDPY